MKSKIEFLGYVYENCFDKNFKPNKTHWCSELQKEVCSEHIHEENAVIDVGYQTPCNEKQIYVRVIVERLEA